MDTDDDRRAEAPDRPIASQPGRRERQTRAALEEATPVFGTAQPPRGASGRLRRWAYSIPETRARRWMLLLAADRVDVLEDRIGGVAGGLLGALGLETLERRVRRDPLPALAAAAAAGALVVARLRRR